MRWTGEQVAILLLNASRGAEGAAEALAEAGYTRSVEAVSRKAYRMGISLVRWDVCVECGAAVPDLDGDGLCAGCRARREYMAEVELWQKRWEEVDAAGRAAEMEARGFRREAKLLRKRRRALEEALGR